MPYAEGRIFNDADSHIMETRDWLISHADADIREKLRPLAIGSGGRMVDKAIAHANDRVSDPAAVADAEKNLMLRKGWEALGAFDPNERRRALDLLGFSSQLVFTTFAITHFWGEFDQVRSTPEVLYGGARAHNRAIADFCRGDKRLLAVGFVPLDIPELAEKEIDEAVRLGCAAIHIPSLPPAKKSPTHPDFNGVWARLQDADVPFLLHVGGGGRAIPRAFHNNDRPVTDFLGGGENIRSKDFMAIHMMPEIFLSTMVLDGIFEQFPRLRGGCIEQGAMWIVPWLRRLDISQATFVKSEKYLSLPLKASDYVRRNLRFTPYPHEPVGWIVEQAGPELCMFSSDYPHIEGGRNPLKRFELSTPNLSEVARERFYATNYADMMGSRAA
ncbi:MAG TPA: amidohydrolase family protein [Candidatus Binatus sp.]|uniref:amidohydrolase family protein n=1 Tax=Candidatus Binatus sp. TaxID=2811406 RepID=UPI002F403519